MRNPNFFRKKKEGLDSAISGNDKEDSDSSNSHSNGIMRHIHFIGIGGIGMSALARFYISKGHNVTGSDLQTSEITDELTRDGV
ncbi:MAG: Mur ligase domain-containing protein, partial [Patescibacteria group bacterium]